MKKIEKVDLSESLAQYKKHSNEKPKECKKAEIPLAEGSVPIIPPSKVVQLQPIVVPIAVVPYESREQKSSPAQRKDYLASMIEDEFDEDDSYIIVESKHKDRFKSIIVLFLSLLYCVPFILAYFKIKLTNALPLDDIDVVGKLISLFSGGGLSILGEIPAIMLMLSLLLMIVGILMTLLTSIIGRYSKIGTLTLSMLPALFSIGVVIYAFVPSSNYSAVNKFAFLIPAGLGLINMIVTIVFTISSYPKLKQ